MFRLRSFEIANIFAHTTNVSSRSGNVTTNWCRSTLLLLSRQFRCTTIWKLHQISRPYQLLLYYYALQNNSFLIGGCVFLLQLESQKACTHSNLPRVQRLPWFTLLVTLLYCLINFFVVCSTVNTVYQNISFKKLMLCYLLHRTVTRAKTCSSHMRPCSNLS